MKMSRVAAWLLRRRRSIATAVGTFALALAGVVAFLPGLLPVATLRPLTMALLGNGWAILALGALCGLVGVRSLYGATTERDRDGEHWFPERLPERGVARNLPTAGKPIDQSMDGFGYDPDEGSDWSKRNREGNARSRIHEAAVAVLAEADDVDRAEAARRIEEGSWTENPRARSYLGGPEAPDPPLTLRIRDWASGEAYERAVGETVATVAERAGVETEGEWT